MRGLTSVLAVLLVGAQVASSQGVTTTVEQAVQRRDAAVRERDGAAWARLQTDDFMHVGPDGEVRDKAQRAADVSRGLTAQTPSDARIRVYGETAVRTFVAGEFRRVEVWVRQGGEWKLAHAQFTAIAKK
jgi:hypothetical protein